jgi:hypothetical protein
VIGMTVRTIYHRISILVSDPIEIHTMFVWLISHQLTVLFSRNKSATSNQPAVLFSQNKPAPAINHQRNEQAASL